MRIPVTNNTKMPIYVGANLVPPGETRDFEEHHVPPHLRPRPAGPVNEEEAAPSTAEALRDMAVKKIVEVLPDLTDEQLAELEQLEQADEKPRVSLLEAISEHKLVRAGGE